MKNSKKTKKYVIAAVVLIAVLVIGGTLAYMFRTTDTVQNTLIPAKVTCEVKEIVYNNKKTEVQVRNTSNIPAYLRVKLVSYYQTESGDVSATPATVPDFILADGWIATGNDTYCYTQPVAVNGLTPNLIADGSYIDLGEKDGLKQVVTVVSEAIQSEPADAVQQSWGVTVTDSVITG